MKARGGALVSAVPEAFLSLWALTAGNVGAPQAEPLRDSLCALFVRYLCTAQRYPYVIRAVSQSIRSFLYLGNAQALSGHSQALYPLTQGQCAASVGDGDGSPQCCVCLASVRLHVVPLCHYLFLMGWVRQVF